MWCHIIMFSFRLVSVFLAWTLALYFSAVFNILFMQSGSFECFPCLVLHVWSACFSLLVPLLLELSAGRRLPLLGCRLPSTMLAFYLECLNIFSHIISIAFILV